MQSPEANGPDRGGRFAFTPEVAAILSLLVVGITVFLVPHLLTGRFETEGTGDVLVLYAGWAEQMLAQGELPYRDFPFEYPPATIPLILLPAILGITARKYFAVFMFLMLIINYLTVRLVWRYAGEREGEGARPARLLWYFAFFAFLSRLVVMRLEPACVLAAFGSAYAWERGRPKLGGFLAGLGALLKIYPGLAGLPGVVRDLVVGPKRRLTGLGVAAATAIIGGLLWLGAGGKGTVESLAVHGRRGLELQTLYSGFLLLLSQVTGHMYESRWTSVGVISVDLYGPGTQTMARWTLPLQLIAIAWTMRQFLVRGASEIVRFAGATILAFLLFGKVMSPQYLIMILPFVAVLEGRNGTRARWACLVACVITLALYPLAFEYMQDLHPLAVVSLFVRNALLVAIWWWMITGPVAAPAEARLDSPHDA